MSEPDADITAACIDAAVERVRPHVRHTPVLRVTVPTPAGDVAVVLKLEQLQATGSFKVRGAFNSLLSTDEPHLLACSGGNHGLAVAWAAARLGRTATIVVPASAALSKVAAMTRLGADVRQVGDVPADAFAAADDLAAQHGWPLVHPYDQPATVCGQGTLGVELREDAPQVRRWLVAVGGGGFAAGVRVGLAGGADVACVETEGCPTLHAALRAGGPVPVSATGVARTSLGAPSLGALAWSVLGTQQPVVSVLVDDEQVARAQRWLWQECRIVAEAGGATALAALLCGAWTPAAGDDGADARAEGAGDPPERTADGTASVGVVVCGGNADALP